MFLRTIFTLLIICVNISFSGPVWQKISGTTSGGTGGGTQPTTGLISYHAFETNAVDTKDPTYNGTASNVGWNDSKTGLGRCMSTLGAASSYVTIPSSLLAGRSKITISLWVYIQQGQATLPIIGWDYNFQPSNQPPLGIFYTGTGQPINNGDGLQVQQNSFRFEINGNPINLGYNQPAAGWYNLVLTANTGTYRLYMNGAPVGSFSASTYFSTTNVLPMYLGLQPYKGYGASPFVMTQTTLDELRVYNYQMSDAEVLALYQSYIQ